jgi:hypothetical protein
MKKRIRVKSYKRNGKRVKGYTKRVKKRASDLMGSDDSGLDEDYYEHVYGNQPYAIGFGKKKKVRKSGLLRNWGMKHGGSEIAYEQGGVYMPPSEPDSHYPSSRLGKIMKSAQRKKLRKSLIRHGDITIFQPGQVPADRRSKSSKSMYSMPVDKESQAKWRKLAKELGY